MKKLYYYYYNKKTYEVHTIPCSHPADKKNQCSLGMHSNCKSAVKIAKKIAKNNNETADGCYYCCSECSEKNRG